MGSSGKDGFGALLQRARESASMTREELARRVGVDHSYIWRLEERSERRPSPETTIALADALQVPDESLNEWLLAAGHEPLPFVTSVRSSVRRSGRVRGQPRTGSSISGMRAKQLEQLGLTNSALDRLLSALSDAPVALRAEITDSVSRSLSTVIQMLECPVETAVIPAAGGQHRLFAAHIVQKLLVSVIREVADAGIKNAVVVVPPGTAESLLEPLQRSLGISIIPPLSVQIVEQKTPLGLGDAILNCQRAVGLRPFAVLLPDDIVEPKQRKAPRIKHLVQLLSHNPESSFVAIAPVAKSAMQRCGVLEREKIASTDAKGFGRVLRLVEKPAREDVICDQENVFGIVGRYLLQPSVFRALEHLRSNGQQPNELTDALELLRTEGEPLYAVEFTGARSDVGEMFARASELAI